MTMISLPISKDDDEIVAAKKEKTAQLGRRGGDDGERGDE